MYKYAAKKKYVNCVRFYEKQMFRMLFVCFIFPGLKPSASLILFAWNEILFPENFHKLFGHKVWFLFGAIIPFTVFH